MKQGWSLLVWLGCIKSKGASMTVADSTGPWSRQHDEASVGVELLFLAGMLAFQKRKEKIIFLRPLP